jgi:hypothetical protein
VSTNNNKEVKSSADGIILLVTTHCLVPTSAFKKSIPLAKMQIIYFV